MFISVPSPGISGVTSEANPRTASRLLSLNWRLMKSCFALVNICFLKKSLFISGFMTELSGKMRIWDMSRLHRSVQRNVVHKPK